MVCHTLYFLGYLLWDLRGLVTMMTARVVLVLTKRNQWKNKVGGHNGQSKGQEHPIITL